MNDLVTVISSVLGYVISLAMDNLPYVRQWFSALEGRTKVGIVTGLCVLVGVGTYLGTGDLVEALKGFIAALITSQVGYVMKPSGNA